MSRLEKVKIRGIRNFGVDDEQSLRFFSPITLVVGKNGCGKTTLIECLKYITTGEYPPNSDRGKYFAHDPKISGETIVRGQVRLQFRSTNGEKVQGIRSIEVTQRAKKLESKSLDSTISIVNANGQESNLSSKCVDFQTQIASFLGVAKPILESVIFCHQEDSSWPLDEGKKVKERFDAIFNATRYNKCLDSIRNLAKAKRADTKNMSETIQALQTTKNLAKVLREDVKKLEDNQVEVNERQEDIRNNLVPINEKIKELEKVFEEWNDYRLKEVKLDEKLKLLKKQQTELRESQAESFTCSDMELNRMIREFDSNLSEKEAKQRKALEKKKELEFEFKRFSTQHSKLSQELGTLEYVHKQHLEVVASKNTMVTSLAGQYDIEGYSNLEEFSLDDTETILSTLSGICQSMDKEVIVKKKEYEANLSEFQVKLDNLRQEQASLQTSISSFNSRLSSTSRDIQTANKNLRQHEYDLQSCNLEDIQDNIKQVEERVEQEKMRVNVVDLNETNKKRQEENAKLQLEIKEVRGKITTLNNQSEQRSQFEYQTKEKIETEKKMEKIMQKIKEDLQNLFPGLNDYSNLRNIFDAKMENIRSDIQEKTVEKEAINRKQTKHTMNIENKKDVLERKEREIKEHDNQLEQLCNGQDFETAFQKSKTTKDLLQKEYADINSSKCVLARYVEKLEVEDPACPLCHRDFPAQDQVSDLISELNGKMRSLPTRLSTLKNRLQNHERSHENLVQTRPQIRATDKLREDVQILKDEIKTERELLNDVRTSLDICMLDMDTLQSDQAMGNSIQGDIMNIDIFKRKIKSCEEKISSVQASFGSFDKTLNMDSLMKKQTKLDETKTSNLDEISANMKLIQDHQSKLQKLNDSLLSLSKKELEFKTKQQESETLKGEIARLKEVKAELETEVDEAKKKIAPLPYKIKSADDECRKVRKEMDSSIDKMKERALAAERHRLGLHECLGSIRRYIFNKSEQKLIKTREQSSQVKEFMTVKETGIKEATDVLAKMQQDIINQRENKRSLSTEKIIREKEEDIEVIKLELNKLKETIKSYGEQKMQSELDQLNRKRNNNNAEICKLKGKCEELEEQRKDRKKKLESKDMKNAEYNYMQKFIKKKCIEIGITDLDKYYRALDQSIMRYHKEKMNTINSIIRELWRTVYKGNDIDTIEIKTDDAESRGIEKRSVFNYRVVMVKNGVEMDMRGRCSAGQKVLSALIIRMALAETFSSNCGILALDEPTTNLDEDNIIALAEALAAIVERRHEQRNFQLIVISHDKPFLEKVARSTEERRFHIIDRNASGLSVIRTSTNWDMVYA